MHQLDLFEDKTLQLSHVRRALAELDLPSALAHLERYLERYPGDDRARGDYELVGALCAKAGVGRDSQDLGVQQLRRLEGALPGWLRAAWHRRMARAIELAGSGDGDPAGLHWLLGDEPERAVASLRKHLARAPHSSRARAYLGDALGRLGHTREARAQYLRAFVDDPAEVDCERIADDEVEALVRLADDYALTDPLGWVAAVGIVEGVFTPPAPSLPPFEAAPAAGWCDGRRFYHLLVQERRARTLDEKVAARRAMRELCPELLAAHLRRGVESRASGGARQR